MTSTRTICRIVLLLTALAAAPALAQDAPPAFKPTDKPAILNGVGIEQKLGDSIPAGVYFHDSGGGDVALGSFLGKRPLVLALVYYRCPMLCTLVLHDLTQTLKAMPPTVGKDFDVLTVSFDPTDTPAVADRKKQACLAEYNRPGAASGWHFLTGAPPAIAALTSAVGFHYTYDAQRQLYAHASGIIVLTPDGKISKYLMGVSYPPDQLRFAVAQAASESIGQTDPQTFLCYCFTYDPTTGKYGVAVSRMLRVGGALLLLLGAGFVANLVRHDRQRQKRFDNPTPPDVI